MTNCEKSVLMWLMKNTTGVVTFVETEFETSEKNYVVIIDCDSTGLCLTKDELFEFFLEIYEVK